MPTANERPCNAIGTTNTRKRIGAQELKDSQGSRGRELLTNIQVGAGRGASPKAGGSYHPGGRLERPIDEASCCAHVEAVGLVIRRATMEHPWPRQVAATNRRRRLSEGPRPQRPTEEPSRDRGGNRVGRRGRAGQRRRLQWTSRPEWPLAGGEWSSAGAQLASSNRHCQ